MSGRNRIHLDNEDRFGKIDFRVNLEAVTEFFERKLQKSRVPRASDLEPHLSIGDRIRKGPEHFQVERYDKYTPEEGDVMGLFFMLLLQNLPLERVQPVPGKDGVLKPPKNTEYNNFHRVFGPRFREWLGPRPTLSNFQTVAENFLKKWCPPNGKNDFKWKDSSSPNGYWCITCQEIERIVFVTTYQYAHATLQYDIWRNSRNQI